MIASFLSRIANPLSANCAGFALPLRLIVGFGFMDHAYLKLTHGPDGFAAALHGLGVPLPGLMTWLVIATELFGGLAVLLGLLIPLVSIPMTILLLVAIGTVHWKYGFSAVKLASVDGAGIHFGPPGYEVDLLYLATLVALIVGGSGPLSLDRMIIQWAKRNEAGEGPR